jgi:hypothetical protein
MKLFSMLLIFFLISCESAPRIENGTVAGLTYTNLSLGVAIDLPEGWSIISNAETLKLVDKKPMTDPERESKWLDAAAKPLVSAYKYRDSDFEGGLDVYVNPNITIITEFIPNRIAVKSTEEYLPFFLETINGHQVKYEHIQANPFQLNEFEFQMVDYEFNVLEKRIQKKTYLYKWGKQLINITLTWEKGDKKTFQELSKSFLSLRFKRRL